MIENIEGGEKITNLISTHSDAEEPFLSKSCGRHNNNGLLWGSG